MSSNHRVPAALLILFQSTALLHADEPAPWRDYVIACLDTLIERGTDVYGPKKTPLMMSVIDVRTMDSPEKPDLVDSMIRFEGRLHRRGERGSNLWNDQPTLRAMYQVSRATGKGKYSKAADDYIRFALKTCRKENGLLAWGSHIHWDCYRDRAGGDRDGRGPHEILIHQAAWPEMYRLDPKAVKEQADLIWKWHVHDHERGRHNRHDDGAPGADFPFSGGSYIQAFAFMHSVTPGDTEYLHRAKLVADWHWRHRNKKTNLVAFVPANMYSDSKPSHFYGSTFASAITGPLASQLLRSYQLTGDKHFREMALSYLLAYDKYGWDEKARTFVGMLNLDGSVTTRDQVPDEMKSQLAGQAKEPDPGYSVPPIGPVDIWPTTIYPLDFPLTTAQTVLYAWEETPASEFKTRTALLRMAQHWAIAIEGALPPATGPTFRKTFTAALPESRETGGTYANNYGRAISFFVHLYRAAGEKRYLKLAENLAQEAIDQLFVETEIVLAQGKVKKYGLFRGHPAKPYYEAGNGVGFLLLALLELDQPDKKSPGAF
ncbi:MAG: hypothetical protein CL477_15920 [Acidobacteria bacterium]|nr:hypothetical protein [Acidobacteriota bacterium]